MTARWLFLQPKGHSNRRERRAACAENLRRLWRNERRARTTKEPAELRLPRPEDFIDPFTGATSVLAELSARSLGIERPVGPVREHVPLGIRRLGSESTADDAEQ